MPSVESTAIPLGPLNSHHFFLHYQMFFDDFHQNQICLSDDEKCLSQRFGLLLDPLQCLLEHKTHYSHLLHFQTSSCGYRLSQRPGCDHHQYLSHRCDYYLLDLLQFHLVNQTLLSHPLHCQTSADDYPLNQRPGCECYPYLLHRCGCHLQDQL